MQRQQEESVDSNIHANDENKRHSIPKDRIPNVRLNPLDDSIGSIDESPRPRKPEHPILHTNHDEHSFVSCIDLLRRSANFIDLLGYVVVDEEDQRFQRDGGLTPGAAWAYRQLVGTVAESVRFATGSLELNSDEEENSGKPEL